MTPRNTHSGITSFRSKGSSNLHSLPLTKRRLLNVAIRVVAFSAKRSVAKLSVSLPFSNPCAHRRGSISSHWSLVLVFATTRLAEVVRYDPGLAPPPSPPPNTSPSPFLARLPKLRVLRDQRRRYACCYSHLETPKVHFQLQPTKPAPFANRYKNLTVQGFRNNQMLVVSYFSVVINYLSTIHRLACYFRCLPLPFSFLRIPKSLGSDHRILKVVDGCFAWPAASYRQQI